MTSKPQCSPVVTALAAVALLGGLPAAGSPQDAGSYRLTLGDAARLAAERSPSVLEAGSRVDAAVARVRQRNADLLPTLNADVLAGRRSFNTASFGLDFPTGPGEPPLFDPRGEVVGPVPSADVRAHAEVPILDLAAVSRKRTAEAGVDAARAEAAATGDAAASSAARAYLAVLRARAEVAAREEDRKLAEELLGVARDQLQAGVAIVLDVTRAQSQLATVKAQLLAAHHHADVAELSLRRVLRLPEGAEVELVDDLESRAVGDTPTEDQALAGALAARGDLKTAEAYRDAEAQALSAVRSGRLPKLSASADDGYYGKGFGYMLNTYTWSLKVSVPVFHGFTRAAQEQEEHARLREMDYRIDDLRDQVAFEVRQALLNLSAAHEQADAAEERLRLSQLEVQEEEDRVRAGVAGTADVVRAALGLNEARTARVDALTALHAARVALAAATGDITRLP
jgi:outer membrane protein